MQLENELGSQHESRNIFHNRYYRGLVRGAMRIAHEEGLQGLYRGYVTLFLCWRVWFVNLGCFPEVRTG